MAALPDTRMPGVKTLEIPTLPPSVALVPTAVPVFIGYTQKHEKPDDRDLKNKPVRIRSMRDYEDWFGEAAPQTITATVDDRTKGERGIEVKIDPIEPEDVKFRMYYALQLYFTNGGGPAYIISVGAYTTPPVAPATTATATTPNTADFKRGIELAKKAKEITILVLPDAVALNAAEYGQVITEALKHCEKYINRVTIIDVKDKKDDGAWVDEDSEVTTNFRETIQAPIGQKKYGAAYYPFLKTTMSYSYKPEDVVITMNTYDKKVAPAPVAAGGGAGGAAAGGAGAAGGKQQDPKNADLEFTTNNTGRLDTLETANNLVFSKIKEAIRQFPVVMPPSAAVAGVYVATDFAQGVWKAPANVSLAGVVGTTVEIDDDFHADLNVNAASGKSVNAIRPYTGRGILIFGARTLAGNDLEWRYISVRRTFCFIEDAVGQAMQDFVFASNTRDTWIKVKAMIGNFLIQIWKAGGLFGNTPDEAFQVLVGQPETMNDIDILEGRMIVDIKLRVSRPAEFIILRYEHKFQTNAN